MEILKTLSLAQLKDLLKETRHFKDMQAKLGKRGVREYARSQDKKKLFLVEYAPGIAKEYMEKKAIEVFSSVFYETPQREEIEWIEKRSLIGGMRVYVDDYAIDLSFHNIEKQLKK